MEDQPKFPRQAADVASTLAELLRHQNELELSELVASAEPSINVDQYDNWDGGTWYCSLQLEVPTLLFARVEPELEQTERRLAEKLAKLVRNTSPYILGNVTLSARAGATSLQRSQPTAADQSRIWEADALRLFLSHISAHKEAATKLKEALALYGISAFVAHEDIEPNLDWQNEIELALGSMHALCAMLTPGFHQSNWTDQEIGFALGRNIPVVSIRLGQDPYGFIGRNQALRGNLAVLYPVAVSIADVLLREARTKVAMRDALVGALERAKSFASAKQIATMLTSVDGFSHAQRSRLTTAMRDNSQVRESWGVPEMIKKITEGG